MSNYDHNTTIFKIPGEKHAEGFHFRTKSREIKAHISHNFWSFSPIQTGIEVLESSRLQLHQNIGLKS